MGGQILWRMRIVGFGSGTFESDSSSHKPPFASGSFETAFQVGAPRFAAISAFLIDFLATKFPLKKFFRQNFRPVGCWSSGGFLTSHYFVCISGSQLSAGSHFPCTPNFSFTISGFQLLGTGSPVFPSRFHWFVAESLESACPHLQPRRNSWPQYFAVDRVVSKSKRFEPESHFPISIYFQ